MTNIDTNEAAQANMEKIVEKVRKLLNLAAKNPNEEEAASATNKANELLLAYNLDMSTIEQSGGESGKREDARVKGGMYVYERELWQDIARLNFCFYFVTREWNKKGNRKWLQFKHRIVGRTVNTASTRAMAGYIQSTIERICRERFPVNSQFFCTEAVAYREGMAYAIRLKLQARRQEIEKAERSKAEKDEEARVRAAKAGISTATALTIADIKKSEEQANYDFLHGEGAWQRREDRKAEWKKEDAERRVEQAKAEAEADAEYAQWAKDHPEEAAKEAAKERARQRAAEKRAERNRYSRRSYRAPSARERREDSNYFHEGHDKGKTISIDPQAGDRSSETRRISK